FVVAQDKSDYFPVKAKSTWVYKVGENTITQECTTVSGTGDTKEVKIDTKVSDKVVASESFSVDKTGVYRTKVNGVEIKPKVKILTLPLPDKDTEWKVDGKIQEQSLKGTFKQKAAKEKVKTDAGEFDAVVVEGSDFDVAGVKTSVKYWFAPGKGIVKLTYNIAGNEAVLVLKEHKEGGAKN
ncbi:MAG TPA: hypothetical protein VGJ05_22455, partial [Fimbriiglobus sp.]